MFEGFEVVYFFVLIIIISICNIAIGLSRKSVAISADLFYLTVYFAILSKQLICNLTLKNIKDTFVIGC